MPSEPAGDRSVKPGALSRRGFVAASIMVAAPAPVFAQAPEGEKEAPELGTLWWGELLSRDPAQARSFYSKVVGWEPKVVSLEDSGRPPNPGEKEYILFTVDGHEAAGAMSLEDLGFPSSPLWLIYIQVADVDKAAKKAVELGGKLLAGPSNISNIGRIAVIEDLEGAKLGLVTPESSRP